MTAGAACDRRLHLFEAARRSTITSAPSEILEGGLGSGLGEPYDERIASILEVQLDTGGPIMPLTDRFRDDQLPFGGESGAHGEPSSKIKVRLPRNNTGGPAPPLV